MLYDLIGQQGEDGDSIICHERLRAGERNRGEGRQ